MPDCIGMNIDEAIDLIRKALPDSRITLRPTFDPKFKADIHLSSMIVVRQKSEGNEIELIIVSA